MALALAPEVKQALTRMDMKQTLVMMGFFLDHALNLHMNDDELKDLANKTKSSLILPNYK